MSKEVKLYNKKDKLFLQLISIAFDIVIYQK